MSTTDWSKATEQLARRIAAQNENPDTWKTALRMEAERLGLDIIKIDFSGTLKMAAWEVVTEAKEQGKTPADI